MGKGAGIVAGLSQDATLSEQFEHAEEVSAARPEDATLVYKNILTHVVASGPGDEEDAKLAEASIYKLGRGYASAGNFAELSNLMGAIRPFFDSIPKAKTAKIVRIVSLCVPACRVSRILIACPCACLGRSARSLTWPRRSPGRRRNRC